VSAHASPPDPEGFDREVWDVVRRVPRGRVITYGTVAALVPIPGGVAEETYRAFGARWVGAAMARCPLDVPWHRVVNARGGVSPRFGGGHWEQWDLLREEGVTPGENGRLDLRALAWPEPPAGSMPRQRDDEDPDEPTQGSLF
jgi:methylated-DNA-protein-cysteine methyltransferase-like protein